MIGRSALGRVAFNQTPTSGPWGGSGAFVNQLSLYLNRRGYRVCYDLSGHVDVIILVDPRSAKNKPFGPKDIAEYKERNPDVRVMHRVNECDQRKNTDFMDKILAEANVLADYTVFISEWVRDYHAKRWFDTSRPNSSIYNGADPVVFHPVKSAQFTGDEPFRLVTHHWSDNWLKGFKIYKEVDDLIFAGELKDTELWVIGRWPESIEWRAARTFPPTVGSDMADKLRKCHAYITASVWEPCGMHHVEGAQCGLPLIYHEDGGGIVEAGEKYGVGFKDDVKTAISKMRTDYKTYRKRLFNNMPSGDKMCLEYTEIIQRFLCENDIAN